MNKWLLLLSLLLIAGCTSQSEPAETKINPSTGVGVLEFRSVVSKMLTDDYNYILLSIRNNAAGNNANDIRATIENVEPFKIYECQSVQDPGAVGVRCNDFFDDNGLPYNTHRVNEMMPDEEIQFLWNIKSPSNEEIVNMPLTHSIYYTLSYDYISTVTVTIACMSQSEYLARSKDGPVTLSGQTISSPGEVKLESSTQQPVIYNEGSDIPLSFTLNFKIRNSGDGIVKPGTNVMLLVKIDSSVTVNSVSALNLGWKRVKSEGDDVDIRNIVSNDNLSPSYILNDRLKSVLPDNFDVRNLYYILIPAEQLITDDYSLILPVSMDTQNIYEPEKILTFNVYMDYQYMKEGSTSIVVYPTK